MHSNQEQIVIQRKLLRIAAVSDWSTREEDLFKEEQALLSENWISIFKKEDVEKDLRIKKYLMLTALPFFIHEEQDTDLIENIKMQCTVCLDTLWRIRIADRTAVLPTGNIAPEYFFVAGEFLDPIPEYANLSYAHHSFMRKALISSGLHEGSWISHLLKFPGLKLERELVKRYPFIEREIELTRPKMVIALGKKVQQALSYSHIPDDIPVTFVKEVEYYEKHKLSYIEYGEAIKNVITEKWRELANESK